MIIKPKPFREPNLDLPICQGLVGLWLMNEGSGNRIADLSGQDNSGTLDSSVTWQGGNLYFPDNKIMALDSTVNVSVSPWSFCFRAKNVSAVNDSVICGNHDVAVNDDLDSFISFSEGNHFRVRVTNGVNDFDQSDFAQITSFNDWHTYSVVSDGTSVYLYRDDIFIGSDTPDVAGFILSDIGCGPIGYFYGGYIDWFYAYNRALSASEIALLSWNPFCMFEEDPIELWSAATQGAAAGANVPIIMQQHNHLSGGQAA